jgi:hypothetical protein
MGLLDDLASKAMGLDIGALASQVGMSEQRVRAVLVALGRHHTEPGDTVAGAAADTGVARDKVESLMSLIGGEDALAKVSGLISGGGLSDMLEDK